MSELRINNITDRAGSSGQLLLVYQQSHQHHTWSCQVFQQKCVVEEEEECLLVVATPSNLKNVMDFVEIATTGNATDFGDLAIW